ncbi:A24 family peptidase [Chthonobacter albigriseus]|uniref:A24 family peptidase n=1 Tax=Chthonobacter albigriseus TaxID=1683161 RepID=UPI0015EE940B|nr:prepilin peptidase [Chthonobacter albigriseus]
MDWLYAPLNDPLATALAVACVAPAAWFDHRTGRIPNWLTYGSLGAGLVLGLTGGLVGLGGSVLGMLAASAVFVVAFAAGSCGGGDVKLMAALGAIVGMPQAMDLTLAALLVGGVLAVISMLRRLDPVWLLQAFSLFFLLIPAGLKSAVLSLAPAERRSVRFAPAAAGGLLWCVLFPDYTPLALVR